MWYFLIKQRTLERAQLQYLQKASTLTEIEQFSEPFENWIVFSVEKDTYASFMDYLDREGISYDLTTTRPTRDEMLATMR